MKILLIIFVTSFIGWFLSSYRVFYLANDKLKKASLLAGVEEVFAILTSVLIIVSYSVLKNINLLLLSLVVAFVGAYLGTYMSINDFKKAFKWIKGRKLTKLII